jgi:hypothetical protein
LRLLIRPLQQRIVPQSGEPKGAKSDLGDVDPFRRIAAVAATLSPLIAGLLANVFGSG